MSKSRTTPPDILVCPGCGTRVIPRRTDGGCPACQHRIREPGSVAAPSSPSPEIVPGTSGDPLQEASSQYKDTPPPSTKPTEPFPEIRFEYGPRGGAHWAALPVSVVVMIIAVVLMHIIERRSVSMWAGFLFLVALIAARQGVTDLYCHCVKGKRSIVLGPSGVSLEPEHPTGEARIRGYRNVRRAWIKTGRLVTHEYAKALILDGDEGRLALRRDFVSNDDWPVLCREVQHRRLLITGGDSNHRDDFTNADLGGVW